MSRRFNVLSTSGTDVLTTLCNAENRTSDFVSFWTSDQRSFNVDLQRWNNVDPTLKCWLCYIHTLIQDKLESWAKCFCRFYFKVSQSKVLHLSYYEFNGLKKRPRNENICSRFSHFTLLKKLNFENTFYGLKHFFSIGKQSVGDSFLSQLSVFIYWLQLFKCFAYC